MFQKIVFLILISIITIFPKNLHNSTTPYIENYNDLSNDKAFSKDDLLLLTKLVNSESHAESLLDKLLVASVVINRVNSNKFPNTIREVIYQRNQFSGINTFLFRFDENNKWDMESYNASEFILTHGPLNNEIIFFLNPAISTNRGWVKTVMQRPLVFKEKNHLFFK